MKDIIIYTDGSCLGNPGPGGYGIVLLFEKHRKELSQGYKLSTNNRMELMAAIKALEALKSPCNVKLYSDSKYVVDAINKSWIESWKSKNWMHKREKRINYDLWQILYELLKIHKTNFHWVKGHNENPENERCDYLAVKAANSDDLLVDNGYLNR